jgi:PAS domain S-box-containing protein
MTPTNARRDDWRAELLWPLARSMASDDPADVVEHRMVSMFVERLARDYPMLRAAYSTIDEDGRLHVVASAGPSAMPSIAGLRVDLTAAPEYLETLRRSSPVVSPDVSCEVRFGPLAGAMADGGTHAVLDVPLRHSDRLVGLLCLDAPAPRAWSSEELSVLQEMGTYLSAALKDGAERRGRQRAESEVRTLLDTLRTAVVMASAERRVTYVNAAFCRLFDLPADRVVGMDCHVLAEHAAKLMADPQSFAPRVDELETRAEPVCDEVLALADGRILERDYSPIRIGAELVGHLMQFRDVTSRRQAETRAVLAEHQAALGAWLGGIGQGVGNPLAALRARLEAAADDIGVAAATAAGEAREHAVRAASALAEAKGGVDRLHDTARLLSACAASDRAPPRVTDVRDLVRRGLELVGPEIRPRARLIEDLADVPPAGGDPALLGQVVLTLLFHASRAVDRSRRVDHEVRVTTRADRQGRIAIEVSDTGEAIPEGVRRRLFAPGGAGSVPGAGLGLLACHGIVAAHGGEIQVESRAGSRNTVRVLLPAARRMDTPARARPKLLVIDDEPQLTSAVRRMLRDEFEVSATNDAVEALARLGEGLPFDVVLSDVSMPGLTGVELHDRLASINPEMAQRFVFMTAGGPSGDGARIVGCRREVVIKPFDREALVEPLRRAVARSRPS